MTVMTSVRTCNHFAAEHLRLARCFVPFHFRRVDVLQIFLAVFVCERSHQGRDLCPFLFKARHQRFDLFGLNKRFVALYVNDHRVGVVLIPPNGCRNRTVSFQTAVCAAFVVGSGHHHFAAKGFYCIVYPIVVGRYYHRVQSLNGLFIYAADDGLPANFG